MTRFVPNAKGFLSADDFRRIWRDIKSKPVDMPGLAAAMKPAENNMLSANMLGGPSYDGQAISFEAGQIFSKFDIDGDGKLNKKEFESLIQNYPELSKLAGIKGADVTANKATSLPMEIVTGRLLTHYDETSGVAIPRTSVDQHKAMGHSVQPLLESYRSRYDHLRNLLTSRLLPRREHIMSLRRQLQNASSEITAIRKSIERETVTDSEQIIERLRSVESMRQSSINHQILQLEEELDAIERVVRRVEVANRDSHKASSNGVLITTALPHDTPIESINAPRADCMVELIQQFSDVSSNIEKLSVKPITVQVEYPTNDFPRETAERLEILAHCDRYMHAITVKDHMLWCAVKEKEKAEEMLEEEKKLSHEYAEEVTKWVDIVQNLTQQLNQSKSEYDKLERWNRQLINTLREHNIFVGNP